jgi:hypothetical protein
MIDPLTALSVATTAVSQFKSLVNAGRDTTEALTKFSGAWADINEAERRANNPTITDRFSGSFEERAALAFSSKRKSMELKKELEDAIQFIYGPSGLKEYKNTLRSMREHKKKTEYAKAEFMRKTLELVGGLLATLVAAGLFGTIIYYIGKGQGKW